MNERSKKQVENCTHKANEWKRDIKGMEVIKKILKKTLLTRLLKEC